MPLSLRWRKIIAEEFSFSQDFRLIESLKADELYYLAMPIKRILPGNSDLVRKRNNVRAYKEVRDLLERCQFSLFAWNEQTGIAKFKKTDPGGVKIVYFGYLETNQGIWREVRYWRNGRELGVGKLLREIAKYYDIHR